jgi:hypothetical protein
MMAVKQEESVLLSQGPVAVVATAGLLPLMT